MTKSVNKLLSTICWLIVISTISTTAITLNTLNPFSDKFLRVADIFSIATGNPDSILGKSST